MSAPVRRPTFAQRQSIARSVGEDVYRRSANASAGPQRFVDEPTGGACDCFLFHSVDYSLDPEDTWPLAEVFSHNWSGASPTFPGWAHVTVTAMFDVPPGADTVQLVFGVQGYSGATRSRYKHVVGGTSDSIKVSGDLYLGWGPPFVVSIADNVGGTLVVDYGIVDVHSICCDAPDPQYGP